MNYLSGVTGGTTLGKTAVCNVIISRLHDQRVGLINQDSFYHSLSDQQSANRKLCRRNKSISVLGARRGFNRGRGHIVPGMTRYYSSSSSPGPSIPPPRVYTQEQLDEKLARTPRKYTRLATQMKDLVKGLVEHNIVIEVESDPESDDSD